MKFLKKGYAYASIFGLLLTASFSYSMLKTFVIAETISTVSSTASSSNAEAASKAAETATVTDTSYSDDNISVTLTEKTVNNTQVYVADVTVSSAEYLKTALANKTLAMGIWPFTKMALLKSFTKMKSLPISWSKTGWSIS